MTTLRPVTLEELSEEDREVLARVARRTRQAPEDLLARTVFGVQSHWPAWLEANHAESTEAYRRQGALPQVVKEAIHVAVSMTNHCEY